MNIITIIYIILYGLVGKKSEKRVRHTCIKYCFFFFMPIILFSLEILRKAFTMFGSRLLHLPLASTFGSQATSAFLGSFVIFVI